MRFTDGYAAAPLRSPTRASLLTGRHPARLNFTTVISPRPQLTGAMIPPEIVKHLPLEEITVAEALKIRPLPLRTAGQRAAIAALAARLRRGAEYSIAIELVRPRADGAGGLRIGNSKRHGRRKRAAAAARRS